MLARHSAGHVANDQRAVMWPVQQYATYAGRMMLTSHESWKKAETGMPALACLWPRGRRRCPAAAGVSGPTVPGSRRRWACRRTGAAPAAPCSALLWRGRLHPLASHTCIAEPLHQSEASTGKSIEVSLRKEPLVICKQRNSLVSLSSRPCAPLCSLTSTGRVIPVQPLLPQTCRLQP